MSHLVESMAYVGQTPWHSLGNQLSRQQPLSVRLKEASMDWSDAMFNAADDGLFLRSHDGAQVLYRTDTLVPLSVVSNRYKVVQSKEVLHFYKDLIQAGGFELETAGVLKGGHKLWALAKTGQADKLKGNVHIKGYLLLATSYDGTLCTTAQFTSVRVVCNNTLQVAVNLRAGAIKMPHSTVFDPKQVKEALGLGLSSWDTFMRDLKAMSQRPVSPEEAHRFFAEVLDDPCGYDSDLLPSKPTQQLLNLYDSAGMALTWFPAKHRLGPGERHDRVCGPSPPSQARITGSTRPGSGLVLNRNKKPTANGPAFLN